MSVQRERSGVIGLDLFYYHPRFFRYNVAARAGVFRCAIANWGNLLGCSKGVV